MRRTALASLGLLATSHALAVGKHGHAHADFHRRDDPNVEVKINVVTVCDLNGEILPQDECDRRIAAGELKWADGILSSLPPVPTYTPPPTTSSTPSSSSTPPPPPPTTSSSSSVVPTSTPAPLVNAEADVKVSSTSKSSSSSSGTGVDVPFPDDIPCSEFPSDYGAVPVNWMGLGGWSGIQSPSIVSALGLDDILTVVTGMCFGDNCCSEGAYCSYACPVGYQKSQWPLSQGSDGQSVGGLKCENGVLQLTNTNYDTLCIKGVEEVTVKAINNLDDQVAVCRTDYPGTEAMVIPVDVQPGEEQPLTCPDSFKYYSWQGKKTTAQYYVNPRGISVEDGCIWSKGDKPLGNWAPLNIGVGYSYGKAWVSIFQNKPTTEEKLDFNIRLEGDNLDGSCKYEDGTYYQNGAVSPDEGCTVSASSGEIRYVFY